MLSAPADYLHSGGFTIPNAGSRGLTGSTPETDRILAFQSVGARIVHDSGTGSIDLPDLTLAQGDNGLAAVAVTDGTLNDSVPLTGTAYAGVGDFVAYLLRTNNNASEPFYIIHGTGTDIATLDSLNQADQIREYSLTADPLRPNNVGAPFFANEFYGELSNYGSTNVLAVERDLSDGARFMHTWLDISGNGTSQKSAVSVLAAMVSQSTGQPFQLQAGRRGSMRNTGGDPTIFMRGNVATEPGPDGGHFFGPNAEHFLLGAVPARRMPLLTFHWRAKRPDLLTIQLMVTQVMDSSARSMSPTWFQKHHWI